MTTIMWATNKSEFGQEILPRSVYLPFTDIAFFLIGIHSMQGRAITTRYRVASKKEKK